MELGQHISQRYNQELEEIRTKTLKMGGLVEKQTQNALKSLLEHDSNLAIVVASSDELVNQMEVEIDEDCARVLAKRQPAAGDLRLILAVIKVITDLERIGDEAEKIARYSKKIAKKADLADMHSELSHLGHLVVNILQDALDSFARMNIEQAIKVVGEDERINKEVENVSRLLITHMMEDPRHIKNALRISWCARALERIADHAQNISEYVIFLVKGKDIRHSSLEHIRAKYFPQDTP